MSSVQCKKIKHFIAIGEWVSLYLNMLNVFKNARNIYSYLTDT